MPTLGFPIKALNVGMHEKLKEKLSVDFKKYTILGACNSAFAYKALQIEDKIGTMLPCNVLLTDQVPGKIKAAAVNPIAPMLTIANPELDEVVQKISQKLMNVVANLRKIYFCKRVFFWKNTFLCKTI